MKHSIRFTVVSLFAILSFLIVGLMFYVQLSLSKDLAQDATNEHFKNISLDINSQMNKADQNLRTHLQIIALDLGEANIDSVFKNQQKYLKIFSTLLSRHSNLYSIYMASPKNQFFELIDLHSSLKLQSEHKTKKTDKWLVLFMSKLGKQTISIYDENLKQTSSKTISSDYIPTQRFWYKAAKNAQKELYKTQAYNFASLNQQGITYVKELENSLVLSFDMLLKDLANKLDKEGGNIISSYIVNKQNAVIVSSSNTDNNLAEILKEISPNKQLPISGSKWIKDNHYSYNISAFGDDYLVSFTKINLIEGIYKQKFNKLIIFTIFIILVLLPIIWYVASFIVRPILELSEQNKKIQNRDFSHVKNIDSQIVEISTLSTSLTEMAQSIRVYQEELEQKVEERTKELKEKNEELRLLSITDKLTSTYNRIKIDETLELEIERSKRYGNSFGIIILDIDFFKSVNDTYGHKTGDSVLVEFANILKTSVRKNDLVGRWGGEEFIIICVEIQKEALLAFTENIRSCVEKFSFTDVGSKTASFGVAMYEDLEKKERLIERADEALYRAKNNGRNRVEFAS